MPDVGPLDGRRVLVGVTGGIAAYKAAEVVSRLVQLGARVDVAMTPAATAFVTVDTFAALSRRPVHDDVLERWGPESTGHISLAKDAAVYVIVPATANSIAKLAAGIADDVVCLAALVATCPLLIAPAMEHHMYHHRATAANLDTLRDRGATILGPVSGRLASGEVGDGRLVPLETLVAAVRVAVGRNGPLAGRRLVITAGGTREPLDPVRYLGNRSSGRMGLALAEAALDAGATVTLISTVADHADTYGVDVILVETADQMAAAVGAEAPTASALIMCAAVADYRPADRATTKLKRSRVGTAFDLPLVENPDILRSIETGSALRVGFAAETEELVANGRAKLVAKRLDLLVANDATATIGGAEIEPTLIFRDGAVEPLPRMSKERFAARLLERVAGLLAPRA